MNRMEEGVLFVPIRHAYAYSGIIVRPFLRVINGGAAWQTVPDNRRVRVRREYC